MIITIEDKRQWAAAQAAWIREGVEDGCYKWAEGAQKRAEVAEAIAEDYRRAGDCAALAGLGRPTEAPAEIPAFLRPQGELPSLGQPIAELVAPVAVRQPVGPIALIAIGAVALALSLTAAWQIDRVVADRYYAGQMVE